MVRKNLRQKNKEKKGKKEKALEAYNNQCKQRFYKFGTQNHKPGVCKCPENEKEHDSEEKTQK